MSSNLKKRAPFIEMATALLLIVFATCGGCGDINTYYKDSDGDEYGDPEKVKKAISQPSGYVTNSKDCNDSDAAIHPKATEACDDGIDNDCDEDIDSDDSDCPVSLLPGGGFTVCSFRGIKTGLMWNVTSETFDCELDGIDTINVDADRDGDFSDEIQHYAVDADGSMSIAGGPEGAFSLDEDMLAVTLADVANRLDFSIALREGIGINIDTFDGPYMVTKFQVNRSTDAAHTYAIGAEKTGHGLGLFRIAHSSNPSAIGFTSPFTYRVEDNGNIEFVDSSEEGMIAGDGTFFMAADADPTNNMESIMIAAKATEGLNQASLQGEYIANLVGRDLVSGEYWVSRMLLTFDGVGFVRYEVIAHTSAGGRVDGLYVL